MLPKGKYVIQNEFATLGRMLVASINKCNGNKNDWPSWSRMILCDEKGMKNKNLR